MRDHDTNQNWQKHIDALSRLHHDNCQTVRQSRIAAEHS